MTNKPMKLMKITRDAFKKTVIDVFGEDAWKSRYEMFAKSSKQIAINFVDALVFFEFKD